MSLVDGTYCNTSDVINLTGYSNKYMYTFGREMTEGEFELFVSMQIRVATDLVNKWCNVDTFYQREITNEYHTINIDDMYLYPDFIIRPFGFGYSPYSLDMDTKRKIIFPRETPVMSVSSVSVNRASVLSDPQWMVLTPRSDTTAGDYLINTVFNSTRVQILKNLPTPGTNNVRITYTAGYSETDHIFEVLRNATSMIVINILNYKRKNQEAATFRQSGVRDMAEMVDPEFAKFVLTDDIKGILNLYRRPPLDPTMYQ